MAEIKTAEQYVVARLEATEKELEDLKVKYALETGQHIKEFEELREELHSAYELLDMLRDFIKVGHTSYLGNYIHMPDNIYSSENHEAVERLMEYYDMRPEEDE